MPSKRAAIAAVHRSTIANVSDNETKGISRREFLNYLWGGSIATGLVAACGAAAWFATPHLKLGTDVFRVDFKAIPLPNARPFEFLEAGCWLTNTDQGLLALSMICVHLPQTIKWVEVNGRFVCPRCGSKFNPDGSKIPGQGPAPRDLDRFVIQVNTPHGIRTTPPDGSPVSIEGATEILINTRYKRLGKTNF
jgi:cytochrome b6-f complex iron-sulfur subunit